MKPVAGSINFQAGVLTLVSFDMPANPVEHLYMNNAWEIPQPKPYVGDVFNSYNDGPPGGGRPPMGRFMKSSRCPRRRTRPGTITRAPPPHIPHSRRHCHPHAAGKDHPRRRFGERAQGDVGEVTM